LNVSVALPHTAPLRIRTLGQTGYSLEDYFDDHSGAVTNGAWSTFSDLVCTPIRRAKNCCVAGLICEVRRLADPQHLLVIGRFHPRPIDRVLI
jgi:hypothetical protein